MVGVTRHVVFLVCLSMWPPQKSDGYSTQRRQVMKSLIPTRAATVVLSVTVAASPADAGSAA